MSLATTAFGLLLAALSFAGAGSARAQWREGPPLESPRWLHVAAARGDYVFAYGGRLRVGEKQRYQHGIREYSIDFFEPSMGRWVVGPPVPPYEMRSIKHLKRSVLEPGTGRRSVESHLEPGTDRGEARAELPFGAADLQGRAWWFTQFGGLYFDARSRTWGQEPSAVFHTAQNDRSKRYYEGSAPNFLRSDGATGVDASGRMYLVGGYGARIYLGPGKPRIPVKDKAILDALEIYDPSTDTWFEAAPMKRARQLLAASVGPDGKLYVFGGCACFGTATYTPGNKESELAAQREVEAQAHPVAVTEMYDPETNTWSDRASMPTPRLMLSAATGKDGKIYVIGGMPRWGGDSSALTEVYDPRTNRWSRGPDLLHARSAHASSVTGDGRIWVIGGVAADVGSSSIGDYLAGNRGGPTRSVEILATAPHGK